MLSSIAAVADLIAAAAVVASVCFLAYELRQTNKQSRLANWRELLAELRSFKALTNDLEFSAFLERAQKDYAALSPSEKVSFAHYLEQGVHVYGNFTKHSGTVPGEFIGLEKAVSNCLADMMSSQGAIACWQDWETRGRLMPATYDRVRKVISVHDQLSDQM